VKDQLTSWLRQMAGSRADEIPQGADISLQWMNLPQSWMAFVAIAGVLLGGYLVFWLYRREIDTCPRSVRMLLAALRVAILLLLVAVLLDPRIVHERRVEQPYAVVVGRDDSQSMKTRDKYFEDGRAQRIARLLGMGDPESVRKTAPPRAKVVESVLHSPPASEEEDGHKAGPELDLLQHLAKKGRVVAVNFSDRVTVIRPEVEEPPSDAGASQATGDEAETGDIPPRIKLPALDPLGQRSDLATAIREAISLGDVSAVVIFTDGQHTGDVKAAEEAAALAAERRIPIYFVGVGDPVRPRNLKLADIYANPVITPDEKFSVLVKVRSEGFAPQAGPATAPATDSDDGDAAAAKEPATDTAKKVRVELLEVTVADGQVVGDPRPLAAKEIEIPRKAFAKTNVSFTLPPRAAGQYYFTARVATVKGERDEQDNMPRQPIKVRVLDKRKRVLLIAGAPTWEFRAVQRLLLREKSIACSSWLQTLDPGRPQEGDPGATIKTLPPADSETQRREFFDTYDAVALFDVNPQELSPAWIDMLKKFINEKGGGLLFVAGPKYSGDFLANPQLAGIRDLLPVKLGDLQENELQSLLSTNTREAPLKVLPQNVDQPLMMLHSSAAESRNIWGRLPGIYWSFPVAGPKETATVLIEHGDPAMRSRPLLVTTRSGAGRVLYMGFSGTWRWRRIGHDAEYFNRYWRQAFRHLFSVRTEAGRRPGEVSVEREVYQIGNPVTVTAKLRQPGGAAVLVDEVTAALTISGGEGEQQVVRLKPVKNQPGSYETTLIARDEGIHRLQLQLPPGLTSESPIFAEYTVKMPSAESENVWLNRPLLVKLATLSGGAYFEAYQTALLVDQLQRKTRGQRVAGDPIPLWDNWVLLVLLVGLLAVEWSVRKANKLL